MLSLHPGLGGSRTCILITSTNYRRPEKNKDPEGFPGSLLMDEALASITKTTTGPPVSLRDY